MSTFFRFRPEAALAGAKELDQQLMALGSNVAPKVMRGALRESVRPVLLQYRAQMRVGTRNHKTYKGRKVGPGFSKKNTYVTTKVSRDSSSVVADIGPRDEAFYQLWFLETVGFTGGRGKRRLASVLSLKRRARRSWSRKARTAARIPPTPRLEPIFKASRTTMLTGLVSSLRRRIHDAIRKTGGTR